MDDQLNAAAHAYDAAADWWDEARGSNLGNLYIRQRVYAHMLPLLNPGDKILEVGAGSGTDAVYLAKQGFRVHATEISPAMVAKIEEKIYEHGLLDRMTTEALSFTDVKDVQGQPYQALFSNFGVLNYVEDLADGVRDFPGVLTPGALVTSVVASNFCPWDLAYILNGKFKRATLRFMEKSYVEDFGSGGQVTFYWGTPPKVIEALGPDFEFVKMEGINFFSPSEEMTRFPRRLPLFYKFLTALDKRLAKLPPFNRWGDYFILSMRYKPR